MIHINQLKLPENHTEDQLRKKIAKMLGIRGQELLSYQITKKSIDARKKPDIFYVYAVDAAVKSEDRLAGKKVSSNVYIGKVRDPAYQCALSGTRNLVHRPVVVGTGPAGLFCGYQLASMGYRPVLLERGASIEERRQDVARFWESQILNPESNVQFGEGGAGTFSDGKLNTLVKDLSGRNRRVLELMHRHGAPEDILYQSKPHIGTDILSSVVQNLREHIKSMGGEVRFHTRAADLLTEAGPGHRTYIKGLVTEDSVSKKQETIAADAVVLAIGHSARDTFQVLSDHRAPMEPKPFAVGVRIEHPQCMVDQAQYGRPRGASLPPASYKLTAKLPGGRGVYTFCMCPGGYVINASSEHNRLCVNGMSYNARDGINANSAVIVTVTPEDYAQSGILGGVAFQRGLEERAFLAGRGTVPVQLLGDFMDGRVSTRAGDVIPQVKGPWGFADVRGIFPEKLSRCLCDGVREFDRKLSGYARPDAVVSGVESRTSSPVRILRGESFQSALAGLYPCGEGAGYAGGIMSAAMDGLKVAEAIAKIYRPFDIPHKD